jgi:hypothetical protein
MAEKASLMEKFLSENNKIVNFLNDRLLKRKDDEGAKSIF